MKSFYDSYDDLISELKKKGLIERVGADKNGHWKVVRGE